MQLNSYNNIEMDTVYKGAGFPPFFHKDTAIQRKNNTEM